jgi:hypothetical protein
MDHHVIVAIVDGATVSERPKPPPPVMPRMPKRPIKWSCEPRPFVVETTGEAVS